MTRDYVGGNFTSFLYAIPVMKNHKAAYLTSNCLRNPDLWPSVEAFNNEYLLINDKETLLRLTQVSLTKESREHLQRIRSMSFPLIPMGNIPLVDFIQWQRKTSTPFQFSQLVPRQNLTHWLYSLFFKLMVPPRRQDRGISIIFTSLNLTAFLRLLIHLHSIGYPSHWLSSVLLSILQNNVTTTARHPETYPLTIEEARRQNPPKKLSTAPFIPELRALTSIFQSLLPFAVLDPSLLTSDRIVHCTIGFKDLYYYDASRPDFILVFRHKKLNKDFRAVPGSDSLRSLLISDAGQRTAVGKAREEGLCVITTFKWDRPAGTVSFWLGENDLEVLVKGGENAWEGRIWRTDYWFPAGGPVNLQTELKKGKLWTGRDGEANTLATI
jgi:hypothetical protein